MTPKQESAPHTEYVLLRRVAVKFFDDFERSDQFQLPYEDGAERYFPDDLKSYWKDLIDPYPEITLKRVYTAVSPERIKELVAEAENRDEKSGYKAPNFLTFFAIDTPSLETAVEIAAKLARWKGVVEYAYVQPLAALPGLSLNQKYLDEPVPYSSSINTIGGVDALYAWKYAINTSIGIDSSWGTGKGIQFVDIEKGWDLAHPSLQNPASKITVPANLNDNVNLSRDAAAARQQYFNGQHGTRVLGILAANLDPGPSPAWKGMAEQATGYAISIYWRDPSYPNGIVQNIENAIMKAIDVLKFGDVILLELETQLKGYGTSYWPIECSANVFPPIRLATALGRTVVEAAGNSGCDLDDVESSPFKKDPNRDRAIFDPNPYFGKDSGAILVGAAVVTPRSGAQKGSRSQASNFGERVNCFAWDDSVHTLDIDINTGANNQAGAPLTTTNFSGTSAASAMVAGAAVVLQAIAAHKLWGPFQPLHLRYLLSNPATGTLTRDSTPTDPNVDKIGVMPNLKLIIDRLVQNTEADVMVRDNTADTGTPHSGALTDSPDVTISPSTGVQRGVQHTITVQVRNRGGRTANNVRVTLYYSKPSTFVRPDAWNLIGRAHQTSINPMTTATIGPIIWPAAELPEPGHYCFVVTVGCDEDPDPVPDPRALTLRDYDDYIDLIRLNNNITWKNFDVVPIPPPGTQIARPFNAPGALDADRPMQLEIVANLPEGAELSLEGEAKFVNALVKGYFENVGDERTTLPLERQGVSRFNEIPFPAGSVNPLKLIAAFPQQPAEGTYEIYARQLYQGQEIGRITWQLAAQTQNEPTSIPDPLRKLLTQLTPLSCFLILMFVLAILLVIYFVLMNLS